MLELKKLSIHDGRDIYEMLQEIPGEENGLLNKANGLTFEEYKEWLVEKQRDSEQAQEIGIEKALVTIRLDNDASKAVALANGGVITDTTDERVLIWIDTLKK